MFRLILECKKDLVVQSKGEADLIPRWSALGLISFGLLDKYWRAPPSVKH